jgi:PAS domain S-box-containing protein
VQVSSIGDATRDQISAPEETQALRALVEGTAGSTGDDFFRNLVCHLAGVLGTHRAFVAEFTPPRTMRTVAYWSHGKIVDNIQFELPGTPCEKVVLGGELCHYPANVEKLFPREVGIESYLGVPLKSKDGTILGHVCVLDEGPMPEEPRRLFIFQIFAARAAAELDRLRMERSLHMSEERFRDLFDEAPIAYVHEDLQSRFIRANRAARRILGITPEQVHGMVGRSLVPDTPDAQRRVREAFESIGKGTDTSGVVLELRRHDNGKPVWVQWWSKPDPSGAYTRTMFIDITDRVVMEQEQARLQAQNLYLQEEIKSVHNFEEIVGASTSLLKVLENVRRVAPADTSVLIHGETGTGKELIARAIHSASQRADKPFIKVNCAALPAGLVESELFGHERGAFTGAIQRRVGRFELARGGTIFLDEIGEMPLDLQSRLLRVLQEQEFERVGSSQTIRTDVRVIAATNRDLRGATASGLFRPDLYYRLNVFPIDLPALRDRAQDIPLLVKFFVQKYAPRLGRRVEAVDSETMQRLMRYAWPGNIRELENIIERALILASGSVLRVEPEILGTTVHAPARADAAPAPDPRPAVTAAPAASESDLDTVQRDHILRTLRATRWVIEGAGGAAGRLGLKPATLRYRMKKLGIARGAEPKP